MALLFLDTKLYGASSTQDPGYDSGASYSITGTGGPFNQRYTQTITVLRTLGVNASVCRVGGWLRRATVNVNGIWQFADGASTQCVLRGTGAGQFEVRNGTVGTVLGTGGSFLNDIWYYVDWEVGFGNTGYVKVWQDGVLIIDNPSCDTTTTANNFCTKWGNFSASTAWHEAEVVVTDDQGPAPWNTRLPPITGGILIPDGDGNYTAWAANGAANRWQCVDEGAVPNDDTDYISSNVVGDKNSVTLSAVNANASNILGVGHYFRERRDDAGPHTVRQGLRIGGTDYFEAAESSAASYVGHRYFRSVSPATGAQFTAAELNGTELVNELVS